MNKETIIYIRIVFYSFGTALFEFCTPISMRGLLTYLEHPEDSSFTPYIWVVALLLTPIMSSIAWQQYLVYSVKWNGNSKAALRQALYEKTLRVRIIGSPEEGQVERNRVGQINNLMSQDRYSRII
jgi:hypothetical protein